jgi:hypothetical protein
MITPPQPEGVGLRNGMPLKWHLVKNEKTVNIQRNYFSNPTGAADEYEAIHTRIKNPHGFF